MKRTIIVLLAILLLAAAVSYAAAENAPADPGEKEIAEWTVMFYLCGSDLESKYGFASGNLREILDVVYPDSHVFMYAGTQEEAERMVQERKPFAKVNVLIETGGSSLWHSDKAKIEISPGELQRWQYDCVSFYDSDQEADRIKLLESLPLASMADPETLADFIRWSAEKCPAKKYALVLWDHGSGALSGIIVDELFSDDILYLYELKAALDDGGVHMEALVIDACLMANLETAWAVKDSVNWMVASEEIVPGMGTAVKDWLLELYTHPGCDGKQLGRTICDMTQIKYAAEEMEEAQSILTWSVIDLTRVERLADPMERFFREISDAFTRMPALAIRHAELLRNAEEYGDGRQEMRDVASVFYNPNAVKFVDSATRNDIIEALSDIVVYSVHGSSRSEARGLSFCYPTNADKESMDVYAANCPFPAYLAYLDAISDWTAPEWVYEKTERLPEFSTNEQFRLYAEKCMTSDGFPAIAVSDYFMNSSGVYYRLYYLDPDTEEVVCLGRTNCQPANNKQVEGVMMYANEPWQWPCLDGVPCAMDMLIETNTYEADVVMYGIPVQIDTDKQYLRCGRLDYYDKYRKREYVIYGAWDEYNNNHKMANRSVKRLTEFTGQEFRLLWPLAAYGRNEKKKYIPAGNPQNMPRALLIKEQPLPAGTYYLEYEVDDMFIRPHVMERFEFHWDGEKVILPDGFVWEGKVQLN